MRTVAWFETMSTISPATLAARLAKSWWRALPRAPANAMKAAIAAEMSVSTAAICHATEPSATSAPTIAAAGGSTFHMKLLPTV